VTHESPQPDVSSEPHPASAERARLARTRVEREAAFRLRYDVYITELSKAFLPEVDHDRGWVKDPEDEDEDVHIFYTGTAEAMTGTLRVQVWQPGCLTEAVSRRYSLHLFPDIARYRVSEAARLVVRPECRGGSILSALACTAVEHVTSHSNVFVCFLYCSPGLVHAFMRLGFSPYPGSVIPNEDGIRLPMFMVTSDLVHLREIGSPLAPLMARHFSRRRPLPDMTPFGAATRNLPLHYETDPERVLKEVRDRLQTGTAPRSRLLEGLTPSQTATLCRCAFVMEIPADSVVMRQGLVEHDLYLVLTGRFELLMGDCRLAELGPGDVLGEVSFFGEPGERVATVRSLTPGRVMVLENRLLERLVAHDPEVACRALYNLGRIVSAHLAAALQASVGKH